MADGRANNGGARPGSGRKPRAVRYAEACAAGEAELVGLLPDAIGALKQALAGGDLSAARLVLEYCFGRPGSQERALREDFNLPATHPMAEAQARHLRAADTLTRINSLPEHVDPSLVERQVAQEREQDLTAAEKLQQYREALDREELRRAGKLRPTPEETLAEIETILQSKKEEAAPKKKKAPKKPPLRLAEAAE